MNLIRYGSLLLAFFFYSVVLKAQDTLTLSRTQCEAVFLKENLLLIAEKLKIAQAEALLLQAKLWPNPTFTFDQVNFWATPAQTGGQEVIPPLSENFGRNQQFGFELEQLILTAGKRKKLMALEQVAVDKSRQYFEELVRSLKLEFRTLLTKLQYLQLSHDFYQQQHLSVHQLTQAYEIQVSTGNVASSNYIRLRALELKLLKNINDRNEEMEHTQKKLKLLMRLPAATMLIITPESFRKEVTPLRQLQLEALIAHAEKHRPDLGLAASDVHYFDKLLAYEKAKRVPDVTLKSAYDRGGNAMVDFIGFGLTLDLPLFNRNQGQIRYARAGKAYADTLLKHVVLSVAHEVTNAWRNLRNALQMQEKIAPGYEAELDALMTGYNRSLTERNVSMLEYLDFTDAYIESKVIILDAAKAVHDKTEELNYTTGTDLIQ